MRILAIDTATEAFSVALLRDGELTGVTSRPGRGHGGLVLPAVDALLADAGLTGAALDAIAVGRGPGAFTGVRIGVSVAQGLSLAWDRPIVPVSDLSALALGALQQARAAGLPPGPVGVLAVLDARLNGLYAGRAVVADPDAPDLAALSRLEECLLGPPEVLLPAGGVLIAAGHGLALLPDLATRAAGRPVVAYPDLLPSAAAIARLAADLLPRGGGVDAWRLVPTYLRDDVATRSRRAPGAPRGTGKMTET